MDKDQAIPALRMLALIATPKLVDKAASLFRSESVPVQYLFNAHGTASNEIIDMLGLGSIEKCILLSMMPKQAADGLLRKLHTKLKLGAINSGVAFTVPINGGNSLILKMLSDINVQQNHFSVRKDVDKVSEIKNSVVAAIINQGFSEDVMGAAHSAGAGGGTVFRSRQICNGETMKQWGLCVQPEKEVVLILTDAENKHALMQAVSDKCGMKSEAKGIVISMPVDGIMGLTLPE